MSFPDPDPTEYHIPAVPCVWCERDVVMLTQVFGKGDKPIEPGDPLLCQSCAGVMIWSAIGNPRRPLEHEWIRLNGDRRVTEARKAIFMSNEGRVNYSIRGIGEGDE